MTMHWIAWPAASSSRQQPAASRSSSSRCSLPGLTAAGMGAVCSARPPADTAQGQTGTLRSSAASSAPGRVKQALLRAERCPWKRGDRAVCPTKSPGPACCCLVCSDSVSTYFSVSLLLSPSLVPSRICHCHCRKQRAVAGHQLEREQPARPHFPSRPALPQPHPSTALCP